jgi:hypothetical protein
LYVFDALLFLLRCMPFDEALPVDMAHSFGQKVVLTVEV